MSILESPAATTKAAVPGRPLFIVGSQRSGTTALASYLNEHPEILVCRERYKYLAPGRITPSLFTFDRILDFRPGETSQSREGHVRILEGKDPARLKWVGDKCPKFVRHLEVLARNNPGARFIVLLRPAGDVAESFQARASDSGDRWPGSNGFEDGMQRWNAALAHTRRFVERDRLRSLLIVDYRFFSEPDRFAPLLSSFLDLELDDRVLAVWRERSARFGERRREKQPLTERQRALVDEQKDHDAERWAFDYIQRQHEFEWDRKRPLRERVRRYL
jgi:hypothetical protein